MSTIPDAAALLKIIDCDEGILCAPTAFGKTTVAAWLIAKRKLNTLILVYRRQLLDQWQKRLATFLDLLPCPSDMSVAERRAAPVAWMLPSSKSLRQKESVNDLVAEYGQVIVDECHHISAFTFEQVMRAVKAKYVVG